MSRLKKEINKIKKNFFSFSDLRKVTDLNDESLQVSVSRMIKSGELNRIIKGYYCFPRAVLDFPKFALEVYKPSYLSLEWALGQHGILSQKSYGITLITTKRANQIDFDEKNVFYQHIKPDLFFGYNLNDGYLLAEPEKAFLDLAYLSLNGYSKFDVEEMNLKLLDKNKIKNYLEKFDSKKLDKLIKKTIELS